MIAQQDSIAIISWKEIKDYLVAVPDGIEAHIPFESLSFIFKPEDVSVNNSIKVDYKEHKKALQMRFIEKVRKNVDNLGFFYYTQNFDRSGLVLLCIYD